MATPVTVCNTALAECGNRTFINSFYENSTAANICSLFYSQKVQAMQRAAQWDFCRRQVQLSLYKAAVINGVVSGNPPPTPWQYEYLYPANCLKVRFLIPTTTPVAAGTPLTSAPNVGPLCVGTNTGIPFVIASDFDANGNPIKVILTNLCLANCVYTVDLNEYPDQWDSLFNSAATALLAAYFINALARDTGQMNAQIAIAKSALDTARAANGNESISNVDHLPDFIRVRFRQGAAFGGQQSGPNGVFFPGGGYDACEMPGGIFY